MKRLERAGGGRSRTHMCAVVVVREDPLSNRATIVCDSARAQCHVESDTAG